MQEQRGNITRRKFIITGIKIVGLVGLGGAIGLAANRFLTSTTGRKSVSDVSAPDYDLKELSAVDPALIKYRETDRIKIDPQYLHLRAVAVGPEDRIYVAADRTVQVFDRGASRLSELRLNDSPRCLTVTDNGTIYIGMQDYVQVHDPNGTLRANWDSLGQNAVLTSIAVSGNDVFAADAGNRQIVRYDASGRLIRRIGKRDEARNIPGFTVPSPYFDLAISPDGLLRVANPGQHRVEAYTFDGDFEFAWGGPSMAIDGFCGCCNPANFAMLPDGRFVTCEKGLSRVKVYSPDGRFKCVVAGPESFAENRKACITGGLSDCRTGGMDVAVDSKGRVLVMDPVERVVRIFQRIEGI